MVELFFSLLLAGSFVTSRLAADMPHDPNGKAIGLGYFRVRSPLLTESRFLYFPAVTEMFHFAAFAQEFRDQRLFDSYPELIAAFHAFQSRLVPRHPPYALNCLTTFIFGFSRFASRPPFKLIHLGRSRSNWSALRLCIADFTTTELSKNYVDFRGHFFGGRERRARMLLASSPGVNRSARLFENRAKIGSLPLETTGIEPATPSLQS